jgi:hypothetical protein
MTFEGLSRYRKATLVAMAYDPRFAIGACGAERANLHRRNFGELVSEWAHEDSNLGPHPYQGCALAN